MKVCEKPAIANLLQEFLGDVSINRYENVCDGDFLKCKQKTKMTAYSLQLTAQRYSDEIGRNLNCYEKGHRIWY